MGKRKKSADVVASPASVPAVSIMETSADVLLLALRTPIPVGQADGSGPLDVEVVSARAVDGLAEALRRSETQRSALVDLMTKIDPGDLRSIKILLDESDLPTLSQQLEALRLGGFREELSIALKAVNTQAKALSDTEDLHRRIAGAVEALESQANSMKQIDVLRLELANLRSHRAALEATLMVTQQALEEHQAELAQIYASKRWRIFNWRSRQSPASSAGVDEQ